MRIITGIASLCLMSSVASHAANLTVYEKGWEGCPVISEAYAGTEEMYRKWMQDDFETANDKALKSGWYDRDYYLSQGVAICAKHIDRAKTERAQYEDMLRSDQKAYEKDIAEAYR